MSKERQVLHQHKLGARLGTKPLVTVLNMSAIPWRPDANLHPSDMHTGGILTCPHVGTVGHDIKMRRGTLSHSTVEA